MLLVLTFSGDKPLGSDFMGQPFAGKDSDKNRKVLFVVAPELCLAPVKRLFDGILCLVQVNTKGVLRKGAALAAVGVRTLAVSWIVPVER